MMRDDADLSEHFAECASATRFEDLPADAVEGAKKSVLDTIGVILAASGTEPAVRAVIDHVRDCGGRQESSILAFGGRVPAAMAAFANGAMAHCLDYDDQTPWGQHSGSSLLPATLAVAEKRGQVPGRELITAVAIGQDLFHGLRRHVDWRKDWMFTTVIGVFTATASAARVLGLSAEQVAHAMGIASMEVVRLGPGGGRHRQRPARALCRLSGRGCRDRCTARRTGRHRREGPVRGEVRRHGPVFRWALPPGSNPGRAGARVFRRAYALQTLAHRRNRA